VRSTRCLPALCTLVCGLLLACSHNNGPTTNSYLRECETLAAGIAGQVRDFPAIALPTRPVLPEGPTEDQQRVYDNLMRIHPLYVNQYYAAFMQRCQAIAQTYNQALDHIGSLDAAGVDPEGVQLMTSHVQLLDEQRDFYSELRSLADHNQTALVRRKSVDAADELLLGLFNAAIGDAASAPAAVAAGLKDVAGAVSKRQAEPYGVGEQVAKLSERAVQLQRDVASYQTESVRLASSLQARFPGQDWSMYLAKQGAPGK